jgi:hypothetical protein
MNISSMIENEFDKAESKVIAKKNDKLNSYSTVISTIEYLVACMECDERHHIGYYGYLSFAVQDGREHVLTTRHKLVTISEIVWDNDKALEIIRIDIKLLLV